MIEAEEVELEECWRWRSLLELDRSGDLLVRGRARPSRLLRLRSLLFDLEGGNKIMLKVIYELGIYYSITFLWLQRQLRRPSRHCVSPLPLRRSL